MKIKRIGITGVTLTGSVLALLFLVFGTLWTGKSASVDTEKAVRNVSLLYLDELATRREQVVSGKLADYISDLDVAIGLLEKSDLSSVSKLQAYQARMKQLYGLEKFAFVDSNGLIYTSRGTRSDIDLYNFDYKNLAEPEISLKNSHSKNRTVIIASPVDHLPFNGQTLVVCFMEININRLLEGFSLQIGQGGRVTTFCNIYTQEGFPLTNEVLGGSATESNLFPALSNAIFEGDFSAEKLHEDFVQRKEGFVSFTYKGILDTMYYVPIPNTDWILTYLIRESVISEQISSISSGIIMRSLFMSLLVAAFLIALFVMMFRQMKKTASITLQKEIADAENRVQQQELEEQLALQQQIARQEKKRNEQAGMITALASDYRSVYYLDLETGIATCYRKDNTVPAPFKAGEKLQFLETFAKYAEKYVVSEYKEKFLSFIMPEHIKENLEKSMAFSIRYIVNRDGKESYEMLKMAGVKQEESTDNQIHIVGFGFTDIDEEMRDSLARNAALSDALKTAEEASKAKTIFLSSMSHEIRTPMNAIIGLDSLALNEKDLSPKTRDYLEKIGSSAEHLLGLINDILDMSRIESGRLAIHNEEFSFSKMLEQVNTIASGQCNEKGLEYNCHIKGHIDDYYIGDDMKIRQVLINILGNAVKFTPKGGKVELTAEKTASFDKKSTLRFTISDTGIGMSKEYLPKLFEAFSQENTSSTDKYGSSGLGMAITKSIVEMMNGKIEVESEKDKGTTFTVTLTLQDSERKPENDGEIEIHPSEMTVLVIDDDEVAAEHAKLVLENAGIAAEIALSGSQAVEMVKVRHARRESYNLIIVDWKMPEMDGVETTRQIRNVTGDESAIIILTAYNWDDILEEATSAGVDSFIAKPIFSATLLDEFNNALKKKRIKNSKAKPKADLSGKRVLLAEDMDVNAQIMMEVLKMRDIEADHAENGKIALEMFKNHEEGYYSAILMDMRMPEMDGLEATAEIRKLDRSDAKQIPIIALTANAFDEDVQRSLQAGLNAHLTKPIQPDVLFETLEELISG
ncbi:MAG: response regulator [Treponema sp.]|nr:response regulator [Treponema sp.]